MTLPMEKSCWEKVGLKVLLTAKEKDIIAVLNKCNEYFNLKSTLRIAGGWVRDKLLGLESDDIDVTVDNMTGTEFAVKLNEYLEKHHLETHSIGTISQNPDKSKHLETAAVRVLGEKLDFVNLRNETYTQEHRIPQMGFGSAMEDAKRRDITINSLFYNIQNMTVEDFTGYGLSDLQNRIVRTPLEPRETFIDDPLRILRVIRFAARFDCTIHPAISKVLRNEPSIIDALEKKVSRERVGIEVEKIITGANPFIALFHLIDFGLYHSVFQYPESFHGDIHLASKYLEFLEKNLSTFQQLFPAFDTRMVILATIMLPFGTTQVKEKKTQIPLSASVVKHALKYSNTDVSNITNIYSHYKNVKFDEIGHNRRILGNHIRRLGSIWQNVWAIACIDQMDQPNILNSVSSCMLRARDWNLEDAFEIQSILDGNEICLLLEKSPGSFLSRAKECLVDWMLENPNGTKEEAALYLKSICNKFE